MAWVTIRPIENEYRYVRYVSPNGHFLHYKEESRYEAFTEAVPPTTQKRSNNLPEMESGVWHVVEASVYEAAVATGRPTVDLLTGYGKVVKRLDDNAFAYAFA